MESPPVPSRIGPFEVRAEIGRGAMGVVYEAVQDEPRRTVALKVLREGPVADATAIALFRREIRALARLDHPSIATLYASGKTAEGLPYFAMERAEGAPLDVWMRTAPEGVRSRLALFVEIADAVAYAHERGVLHRDLKPSNVIVRDGGSAVKVLDFGLARIVDAERPGGTAATEFGTIRGTLEYLAPEQLAGDPDAVDGRADVYSLGVLLYELLLGEHPLPLADAPAWDLPRRILEEPAKPPGRRLGADLATIVLKAIEKDRDQRYASVRALADDVGRYLAGEPIAARPPSAAYQFRKLVVRHKAIFSLLAASIVVLAGFGLSMAQLAGRLAEERDRANAEAQAARASAAAFTGVLLRHMPTFGYLRLDDPAAVAALADQIDRQWEADPARKVELLQAAGLAVYEAGSRNAGIRLLERALEAERAARPGDVVISSARVLGEIYVAAGRPGEAEPLFRQIVDGMLAAPKPPPARALGYAKENLGTALRDLGRFDEAETLIRDALRLYGSEPIPNGELIASAHDSLGNLHLARNDLAEAERDHRRALEIRSGANDPNNPRTLRSEHFLGLVLARRGKCAEAVPMLGDALSRRERTLGPDHPETLATREALALCSTQGEVALRR